MNIASYTSRIIWNIYVVTYTLNDTQSRQKWLFYPSHFTLVIVEFQVADGSSKRLLSDFRREQRIKKKKLNFFVTGM